MYRSVYLPPRTEAHAPSPWRRWCSLITSKLDDILDDDGNPDLQKLNRLRDMIRDETSRASDSYVKAATVQRSAPQPIEGYNPTVPGYRSVNGTKYFVWQPARYADSVPS